MPIDPKELKWDKHHGVPGLRFGIGLQSVFERPFVGGKRGDVRFEFDRSLIVPGADTAKMVFLGHSDHTTDKVYLPAKVDAESKTMSFMPFVLSPEPNFHKIELQRRDDWAVVGRHGEDESFGLSKDYQPLLRLAFPNETGRFPDTHILLEKKGAEGGFLTLMFFSSFSPRKFIVGEPVVVSWAIVPISEAPECLQKALENRRDEIKINALADEQVSAFAKRRGLTRK